VGADPGRLRIALQTTAFNGAEVDSDCAAAVRDAADLCRNLGHEVEEVQLAVDREAMSRACGTIICASLRTTLAERSEELGRKFGPDDVEPLTWMMVEGVKQTTAADYVSALRTIHRIGRQVAEFLEPWDMLLTPTMATPPLPLGRLALDRADFAGLAADLARTIGFTQLFNASGHPAMSVPLYWSAAGLPIGVQFAGRFGDEATLFRLAAQLESARPWFLRRPAIS
jgi:Asp-tRNA(Asn)/Glu-tRNA(Gln) amidotransferase A subunit family amidase